MFQAERQVTLDKMLDHLKPPKVISCTDFDLPIFITCDVSNQTLGAILYQKQHGVNRVMNFDSRTLPNLSFALWEIGILSIKVSDYR